MITFWYNVGVAILWGGAALGLLLLLKWAANVAINPCHYLGWCQSDPEDFPL